MIFILVAKARQGRAAFPKRVPSECKKIPAEILRKQGFLLITRKNVKKTIDFF